MALLDTDELNELKSKVNLADLISQYVALSRNGKNFIGLCPFHGEKTPSFNVNAEKGFYHCFGCGKSGDAIEFLKEYKQIGFVDALKELADFAGVALDLGNETAEKANPNAPLYDINNQAARLYHILLMSTELGEKAREYLAARGISLEVIKKFNIGLAPEEDDFIYQNVSSKFDEEFLVNSGLFHFSNRKVFDAFSNRIMFPIRNEYGQGIGFSGRKWQENDDAKAKYVNTSVTPIFDKSYELWNFDRAKPAISRAKEVYLMEGFMDVIAADKAGITNVVASMGTALTEKHVRRLKQSVKKFVLVYDGDSAGQNAIYKAMKLIGESSVDIVKVPEGLDPDEYSKAYGLTGLSALMKDGRIQPIEFLIDFLRPANLANLQVQLDFIEQMAPMIARVPSITAQDAYVRKLVEILPDFEYNQVERAVNARRENMVTDGAVSNDFEQNHSGFSENSYAGAMPQDFGDFEQLEAPNFEESYFENVMPAVENPEQNSNSRQPRKASRPLEQQFSALQVPKLSRSERAEEMLLHRMIYHSSVLHKFAQDENFRFVHKRYQDLFEKIMLEGMAYEQIDHSHLASELSDDARSLFYQILSLDLPDSASSQEINDLVSVFEKEMEKLKFDELMNQLHTAQKTGNKERELELTLQIINQKKKL